MDKGVGGGTMLLGLVCVYVGLCFLCKLYNKHVRAPLFGYLFDTPFSVWKNYSYCLPLFAYLYYFQFASIVLLYIWPLLLFFSPSAFHNQSVSLPKFRGLQTKTLCVCCVPIRILPHTHTHTAAATRLACKCACAGLKLRQPK